MAQTHLLSKRCISKKQKTVGKLELELPKKGWFVQGLLQRWEWGLGNHTDERKGVVPSTKPEEVKGRKVFLNQRTDRILKRTCDLWWQNQLTWMGSQKGTRRLHSVSPPCLSFLSSAHLTGRWKGTGASPASPGGKGWRAEQTTDSETKSPSPACSGWIGSPLFAGGISAVWGILVLAPLALFLSTSLWIVLWSLDGGASAPHLKPCLGASCPVLSPFVSV